MFLSLFTFSINNSNCSCVVVKISLYWCDFSSELTVQWEVMQSSDGQRVEGAGTSGSDDDGQLEAPVISVTVNGIGQNKISNK